MKDSLGIEMDTLWHLEAAHDAMLNYQEKHHIEINNENLDWFDIMAFLAAARRLLKEDEDSMSRSHD